MNDAVIKTHGLSKSFGTQQALKDISISIQKNQTTGLVGPNGAGKTTLFSLMCGFLSPTSGSVEVLGHDPQSIAIKGRFSILPQDASLLKTLPVGKQLSMLAELQGLGKKEAQQEAIRVIKLVDLYPSLNQIPEQLSHGMLKRIAIAQAFIGSPEVILLDEPTAGLDPNTTDTIKSVIRTLSQQTTIVITSHNLEVIEDLCQSIIILNKGQLDSHQQVADLTSRSRAITFKLEQDASPELVASLKALPMVSDIKTGKTGQHRLVVYYNDQTHPKAEIDIIQALLASGQSYREMVKGERLQDSVTDRLN